MRPPFSNEGVLNCKWRRADRRFLVNRRRRVETVHGGVYTTEVFGMVSRCPGRTSPTYFSVQYILPTPQLNCQFCRCNGLKTVVLQVVQIRTYVGYERTVSLAFKYVDTAHSQPRSNRGTFVRWIRLALRGLRTSRL